MFRLLLISHDNKAQVPIGIPATTKSLRLRRFFLQDPDDDDVSDRDRDRGLRRETRASYAEDYMASTDFQNKYNQESLHKTLQGALSGNGAAAHL